MGLRRFLLLCAVLGLHGVAPVSAQTLWPGQGASQAWVQFANGAWGRIVEMSSTVGGQPTTTVEFWDGTQTRTHTYLDDAIRNGTNGAPRYAGQNGPAVSASKWGRFAAWAGVVGRGVGYGTSVMAVLYPDALGDATLEEHCQGAGYEGCLINGFGSCQVIDGCQSWADWMNIPCNDGNYLNIDNSPNTSGLNYCPLDSYPEHVGSRPYRRVNYEAGDLWAGQSLTENPTEDQLAALSGGGATGLWGHELGEPGALNPGGGTIPDVFDPIPMPPGFEDLPATEMNPGGYPADGEGVTRNPTEFPTVEPWPTDTSGWPADHPAAPTTHTPGDAPPSPEQPGEGEINVEVNFPDQMDVEVQNWPETPASELEGELEENVIDFGNIEWGPGWMPAECPAPMEVDLFTATIEIPYEPVCSVAEGIAPFLIALTLITGGMYAMRSL
jgi:hypothetical protein